MIYDLKIDGFKISGDQYQYDGYTTGLGLLVCDVLASTEGGSYSPGGITLRDITVTNSSIEHGEARYVGGLIGWCDYASIQSCVIDSTVALTNTGNVPGIGAFIGKAEHLKNPSIAEIRKEKRIYNNLGDGSADQYAIYYTSFDGDSVVYTIDRGGERMDVTIRNVYLRFASEDYR